MLGIPNGLAFFDIVMGIAVLVLLQYIFAVLHAKSCSQSYKLPPGPKGLPLIGNLFDLPKSDKEDWLHWAKHRELYGPISSVTVFGQSIILLNDWQTAVDLLDGRSATYSDRPTLMFGGEMCGWSNLVLLQRYGPKLQIMRRHIHKFMGTPKTLERFHDVIHLEARRLVYKVNETPEALQRHIRSMAASLTLNMAYGYKIDQKAKDPLVELADEAIRQAIDILVPGKWLVDTIPAMRHIPDWFPGATFKKTAKHYLRTFTEFKDKPHAFVKQELREGTASSSFTADLLEGGSGGIPAEEHEEIIKNTAVTIFGGGSDTTVSGVYGFFLAMALYPDVQKRAKVEIDTVVGTQRLPAFADLPNLPYINAIVKETHRWNSIIPLGFTHMTSEDDVYQGYFIPKGAPVMANIWLFTHNPDEYHDPMNFKPERFLTGDSIGKGPERDPREVTFGFGRRICPGREVANASMLITIAVVLAVFDIKLPRDANGREVKPRCEYTMGLASHPKEFECIITPRSDKARALITSMEDEYPFNSGDAEKLRSL